MCDKKSPWRPIYHAPDDISVGLRQTRRPGSGLGATRTWHIPADPEKPTTPAWFAGSPHLTGQIRKIAGRPREPSDARGWLLPRPRPPALSATPRPAAPSAPVSRRAPGGPATARSQPRPASAAAIQAKPQLEGEATRIEGLALSSRLRCSATFVACVSAALTSPILWPYRGTLVTRPVTAPNLEP